jgi:hypothetical protein
MRTGRLQELEELAMRLLATARELPPGPSRHDALQLIGKFRVQIAALHREGTLSPLADVEPKK